MQIWSYSRGFAFHLCFGFAFRREMNFCVSTGMHVQKQTIAPQRVLLSLQRITKEAHSDKLGCAFTSSPDFLAQWDFFQTLSSGGWCPNEKSSQKYLVQEANSTHKFQQLFQSIFYTFVFSQHRWIYDHILNRFPLRFFFFVPAQDYSQSRLTNLNLYLHVRIVSSIRVRTSMEEVSSSSYCVKVILLGDLHLFFTRYLQKT